MAFVSVTPSGAVSFSNVTGSAHLLYMNRSHCNHPFGYSLLDIENSAYGLPAFIRSSLSLLRSFLSFHWRKRAAKAMKGAPTAVHKVSQSISQFLFSAGCYLMGRSITIARAEEGRPREVKCMIPTRGRPSFFKSGVVSPPKRAGKASGGLLLPIPRWQPSLQFLTLNKER